MSPSKPLRAVADGEKAPPKSITEAAALGSHRELLVAMRDRIAKSVEDPRCPPRDLASLSRRLMEIAKDIEALDHQSEEETASAQAEDSAFDSSAV